MPAQTLELDRDRRARLLICLTEEAEEEGAVDDEDDEPGDREADYEEGQRAVEGKTKMTQRMRSRHTPSHVAKLTVSR